MLATDPWMISASPLSSLPHGRNADGTKAKTRKGATAGTQAGRDTGASIQDTGRDTTGAKQGAGGTIHMPGATLGSAWPRGAFSDDVPHKAHNLTPRTNPAIVLQGRAAEAATRYPTIA